MAKLTRESLVTRVFSDPKNYPYGFSRSGDFSISESKALSQYGCLIAALADGQLEPTTEEDKSYLASLHGEKPPGTVAEKAWLKYQKRINRPKMGSIYGSHRTSLGDDEDSVVEDSDLEIEMDD
ncbi:DUF413 domain-containing protein [Paraglaciecola hydrolytica]|uniref:Macrodomain Ori protein n=1 Tax=Paraglaciecola hydrolytica TaxID=1799789 RepID=A0A135ZZI8_9ALTE|nr:DUF413 domain-containing protein [Paraglaciecola hydrolytica]KXI28367.1 hypothetical protein AX660_18560 [Paraglaciecola hydrolytica]